MVAAAQAGEAPKIGPHVGAERAEYTYITLRDLMTLAYGVKPYQVSGPAWLASQRFDIVAKFPDGAVKDDAPKMLQALLEDRFGLAVHRSSAEHPVLAPIVGRGGPKLKESGIPSPIDEAAPLKPGEITMDTADGPTRMTLGKDGSGTVNMRSRGLVTFRTDPATRTMHLDAKMITMAGVADMLTQFSQMMGGSALQFVDRTGLGGHYEIALDFSQSDRANMARAMGLDTPGATGGSVSAGTASDPAGMSLLEAVQTVGLKLEQREAVVEQIVVDRVEKTPTGN